MLRLMWEFFKAGAFAIGGGMATFPFLLVMADKFEWFSKNDLLDMIAISESTPGAIGVNAATFAGFKAYGLLGGIVATVSLIAPAIIIILIISRAMNKFKSSKIIKDSFAMIRPSTAGLILGAMFSIMYGSLFNMSLFEKTGKMLDFFKLPELVLFSVFFFILRKYKKIHPLLIIVAGALAGLIFNL